MTYRCLGIRRLNLVHKFRYADELSSFINGVYIQEGGSNVHYYHQQYHPQEIGSSRLINSMLS